MGWLLLVGLLALAFSGDRESCKRNARARRLRTLLVEGVPREQAEFQADVYAVNYCAEMYGD